MTDQSKTPLTTEQIFAMRRAMLEAHELHPLTPDNIMALCDMALSNAQLESALAEARKDAERYRWLRAQLDGEKNDDALIAMLNDCWSDELDIRIDSAIDVAKERTNDD